MDTIEAIILGIVQGLTEFLPVSSSGHLQIAKALMGVEIEQNLLFDVTLHAATVLSTIVVLWSEVARLLRGLFSRRFNEEQAYVLKLLLSMIPIGIVGFTLKDRLDALLESPAILLVVGCMLLVTAALPGLSRSGSTIATGLLLGNRKQTVAQFSFLMVLAPILGETFLELMKGNLGAQAIGSAPLAAGFVAAFVVGCLACKFMIEIVKRGKLVWFALYCAAAGTVSILSYVL